MKNIKYEQQIMKRKNMLQKKHDGNLDLVSRIIQQNTLEVTILN